MLAAVAQGEYPQADKFHCRSAPTLQDAWQRFEVEQLPLKKKLTLDEYESQWRGLVEPRFVRVKVENISRSEIDKFHKLMRDAPYRANRVLALFSRLMSLTETWEWRAQGTNPCRNIERFPEKARPRFLNAEELGGDARSPDEGNCR